MLKRLFSFFFSFFSFSFYASFCAALTYARADGQRSFPIGFGLRNITTRLFSFSNWVWVLDTFVFRSGLRLGEIGETRIIQNGSLSYEKHEAGWNWTIIQHDPAWIGFKELQINRIPILDLLILMFLYEFWQTFWLRNYWLCWKTKGRNHWRWSQLLMSFTFTSNHNRNNGCEARQVHL